MTILYYINYNYFILYLDVLTIFIIMHACLGPSESAYTSNWLSVLGKLVTRPALFARFCANNS